MSNNYNGNFQNSKNRIFEQQMNYLTSLKTSNNLKPKVFYGNTALSMQDPNNPITYWLYRQPR
jgi:hypothetical protein